MASMDELQLPLQFVVLAGKNKELQEKLQEETKNLRHAVRVLGYTDRIPELMRAAAMLVTKPGALTVCEALVSETPLLLYEPIPGQEWENAVFLTKRGVALWAKKPSGIKGWGYNATDSSGNRWRSCARKRKRYGVQLRLGQWRRQR